MGEWKANSWHEGCHTGLTICDEIHVANNMSQALLHLLKLFFASLWEVVVEKSLWEVVVERGLWEVVVERVK